MTDADTIIAALGLEPHPEGGHYSETWRAEASEGERLFSMGGHEDGLVAFGRTPDEAGRAIEAALERLSRL